MSSPYILTPDQLMDACKHIVALLQDKVAQTTWREKHAMFEAEGFSVDAVSRRNLQIEVEAAGLELGLDVEQIELPDWLTPYGYRMPRSFSAQPSLRMRRHMQAYNALHQRYGVTQALAKMRWEQFSTEVNARPLPTAVPLKSRKEAFRDALISASIKFGFAPTPLPLARVKQWHRRPQWLDAAVQMESNELYDLVGTCETARPVKHARMMEEAQEPPLLGVSFDDVETSIWVVPRQAKEIVCELVFPAAEWYRWFYSNRGLQHCVEARVLGARLLVGQ